MLTSGYFCGILSLRLRHFSQEKRDSSPHGSFPDKNPCLGKTRMARSLPFAFRKSSPATCRMACHSSSASPLWNATGTLSWCLDGSRHEAKAHPSGCELRWSVDASPCLPGLGFMTVKTFSDHNLRAKKSRCAERILRWEAS